MAKYLNTKTKSNDHSSFATAAVGLLNGFVFDKFKCFSLCLNTPLLSNSSVGTAARLGGVMDGTGVSEVAVAGALLVDVDGSSPPPQAQQLSVAEPISPLYISAEKSHLKLDDDDE